MELVIVTLHFLQEMESMQRYNEVMETRLRNFQEQIGEDRDAVRSEIEIMQVTVHPHYRSPTF